MDSVRTIVVNGLACVGAMALLFSLAFTLWAFWAKPGEDDLEDDPTRGC